MLSYHSIIRSGCNRGKCNDKEDDAVSVLSVLQEEMKPAVNNCIERGFLVVLTASRAEKIHITRSTEA